MKDARKGREVRHLIAATVGVATLLLAGAAWSPVSAEGDSSTPRESPGRTESASTRGASPAMDAFREPTPRAEAEREATAASREGREFPDPADSERLARALESLRSLPAPTGEVFALVKATDRATGERRLFTRGTADPMLGLYLDEPASAPPGKVYSEVEDGWAVDGIEVVIRSVLAFEDESAVETLSAEDEAELELHERNAGSPYGVRVEQGLRERLASLAGDEESAGTGETMLPVMVELKGVPRLSLPKASDPANGGLLWAGLDVLAERQRRLIERKRDLAAYQEPVVARIEELGGVVEYASWASGSLQVMLPAVAVKALASHERVFSMEYLPPAATASHRYDGSDLYVATNAEDYDPWHPGWHGLSSKHSYTSRIVVAMAEECVDRSSPAWRSFSGSALRGQFWDLDPNPITLGGLENCWNDGAHGGTGHAAHQHGHWVLGNMAGDFMDGQEAVLTTGQRRQRSGTCEECYFLFGQDYNLNERAKSHDWACERGADIFQSSIGYGSSCDGNGSFDANLQSLVNCDVAYVQAAFNSGSTGGCTTVYPADHPWTFTVGGMRTEDPCDTPGEYYTGTCVYDTNASKGGANYDGCATCASIVDLTGPYRVNHGLRPGTANPTQVDSIQGTSFATPVVAGLMARVMDWWRQHVSNSLFYDNRVRNWMMLMGDRSAGAAGTGQWLNTTDDRWGAGRVHLEPFDDLGCWSIFRSSVYLLPFQSYSWVDSVPDCATFYKAVVWHTGTDYSNEPMIRLTLNPEGCSTPTEAVDRLDSKSLLRMSLNGCTGVRITVRYIPVGFAFSGRRFHVGAYGKSGFSDRNF